MFHEEPEDLPASVADLRAEYAADLAWAIERAGIDDAVERTGLDRETVERVADGDPWSLSLSEAAAVAALAPDAPGADTIAEVACDTLLLGMSMAVLDVDAVATGVEADLGPKEVQQKLERRAPMEFGEFVALQWFVESRR